MTQKVWARGGKKGSWPWGGGGGGGGVLLVFLVGGIIDGKGWGRERYGR